MTTLSDDYGAMPRGPTRQPYRGPRRRHRETGRVEVWIEGQGYVPEGSLYTIPPQDREDIAAARGNLGIARRNAQQANQFIDVNRQERTGQLSGLPVPTFAQSGPRQLMEGYSTGMLRANVKEGTSGTLNSIVEQILARQQYPSTEALGPTNFERGLNMMVDADEVSSMLEEAEKWYSMPEHRGLQGFDVWWNRQSPRIRAESRRRHLDRYQRAWREGPYAEGAGEEEPLYDTSARQIGGSARRERGGGGVR